MTQTPLDPDLRDYLRALQMLLARAVQPPALFAFESLRTVLDSKAPVDWDHETKFLLARLGEVERART